MRLPSLRPMLEFPDLSCLRYALRLQKEFPPLASQLRERRAISVLGKVLLECEDEWLSEDALTMPLLLENE